MQSNYVEPAGFRSALGQFATGVTIVTARCGDDVIGVTANSFNSVSLDPPLVLWSLSRRARSFEAFRECQNFAVNVLSEDQRDLSTRFATASAEKYQGVEFRPGCGGAPLLEGCAARFQCELIAQHDGGDHVIFVGKVLAFDETERKPLVFHKGNYAIAIPHANYETRHSNDECHNNKS